MACGQFSPLGSSVNILFIVFFDEEAFAALSRSTVQKSEDECESYYRQENQTYDFQQFSHFFSNLLSIEIICSSS
jgi:hypothetical protein